MLQRYTFLERTVKGGSDGPGSGQKPSHNPMQSQWQPSPSSIWDTQALRMTSGKDRVLSVPPQMSWQETDFSLSKGKSVSKCVSVDSSRSQLLSSDRPVTKGTQRGLSVMLKLEAHLFIILITETRGWERKWGSTGKGRPSSGTKHFNLNSEDLTSIPGFAIHKLCSPGPVI